MKLKKKKLSVKNTTFSMDQIVKDDQNNDVLLRHSEKCEIPLTGEDKKTMKFMIDFVKASQDPELSVKFGLKPGVGISAPQIGKSKQMFYVRVEDQYGIKKPEEFALVNPEIIKRTGRAFLSGGEGCLSVDRKIEGYVLRDAEITIKGFDYFTSTIIEIVAKGYVSIVMQHEYDHLKGIMFYERINPLSPMKKPKNAKEITL